MQRHRSRHWILGAPLIAILAVAGCSSDGSDDDPETEEANPASVYCVDQGGEVEIVDTDDGEAGVCHLPDGTSVDEWEYFRENNPDVTTP
ncbi:MAG: DUF333 domain-containing protein [Ilumatobacteraceae bacterium]